MKLDGDPSDQAKPRASTRSLRVRNWIGTVPAIAECTVCSLQFKISINALKRVADAQESLRVQFAEHTCNDNHDDR
jgi:hypothetical protein